MSEEHGTFREQLDHLSDKDLREVLSESSTTDLIYFWDDLSEADELRVFSLLDKDKKVDLINELPPVKQEALITALSGEHVKILLEEIMQDEWKQIVQLSMKSGK